MEKLILTTLSVPELQQIIYRCS